MRPLAVLLFLIINFSSLSAQNAKVIREGSKLFLVERGRKYDVDPKILLAKVRNSNYQMKSGVKPLFVDKLGIARISVPDSIKTEDYKIFLEKTNDFEFVEFNTIYLSCSFLPNDVDLPNQWHLAKINAYDAWEITKGSSAVKVAVIENNGISCNHPDIGMGTDGYTNINISSGYNYVNNTTTHTPTHYHGTFVAGVLAAKTNNSIGIAGIAGGDNSAGSIVIPYQTGAITSNIISAINDAVDEGAKVINMSFGGPNSSSVETAIQNAYIHGVTMVCASGNSYSPYLYYPASSQYTIAVGATNKNNQRVSFSNYGTGIDLVAPGDTIYSTKYDATNNTNTYGSDSGTSYAAPQVSGTIALMLSVNPFLTPTEIRKILRKTAYKLNGYTYTNGWNQEVGYGLLNSYAAVLDAIQIIGPSSFCNTAFYSINYLPAGATVTWNVGYMNITSGQGTGSITVSKTYDGLGWVTADIYLNNVLIKSISMQDIAVGTPPLDLLVYPVGPDGMYGWDFTRSPNGFEVDDVIDQYYSYYQMYLYKQNGNSWTQVAYLPYALSGAHIVYHGYDGWYKMKIRGYGECGFSDWWELEVLSSSSRGGGDLILGLDYNSSTETLTVRMTSQDEDGQAQRSTTDAASNCIVQLWDGSHMVKSIKTDQSECQMSLSGMHNGVYFVRVLKDGKCYAEKFVKN